MILCVYNTVFNLSNRKIACRRIYVGIRRFLGAGRFFGACFPPAVRLILTGINLFSGLGFPRHALCFLLFQYRSLSRFFPPFRRPVSASFPPRSLAGPQLLAYLIFPYFVKLCRKISIGSRTARSPPFYFCRFRYVCSPLFVYGFLLLCRLFPLYPPSPCQTRIGGFPGRFPAHNTPVL